MPWKEQVKDWSCVLWTCGLDYYSLMVTENQAARIWRIVVGCSSELHSMKSSTVGFLMIVLWLMRFYKCQRNPTPCGRYMAATWPRERVCFAVSMLNWLLMRLKSLSVPKHSSYETPEKTAKDMTKKVLCPVYQVKKSQDPGALPQHRDSQGEFYWLRFTNHELLTIQQVSSRPRWMKGLTCVWVHISLAWAKYSVISHTCSPKEKLLSACICL